MKTNLTKVFLTIAVAISITSVFAQGNQKKSTEDPVLLTVAGEKITKSEFLSVYNKNNLKNDIIDKKSLEEYLELFVNFKLKVKEAESMGLDTVTSFKTELAGYRKQLAQPYLLDKDVNDNLLQEAYDRLKLDVRASHILVKVGPNAIPKDTLIAYNKIMSILARIKKGEDFGKVARETSEDPSARDMAASGNRPAMKGNSGDLGYFSVLDLVYPFEVAAYNTKVGEVSAPVRTDFGYHLVKVTDRKPAMGKVQVAHILVTIPENSTKDDSIKLKSKIFEIYGKIKEGSTFEDMAKEFSDDKASGAKGGVIPWFGVNRMVPEFIVAISKLKNKDDISEPVQTTYGWHIIKFLDRKGIASFDSVKTELKNRIGKDSRASKSKDVMIARIKKDYKFKEDFSTVTDFYKVVNDSIFSGKWNIGKASGLTKTMFTIGDKQYNQQDFAIYLNKHQFSKTKEDSSLFVNKIYKQFVEESVIDYEDSKLEGKYPEFSSLMKEYRDGILLFELTDEKVWSKAVKDTTGLQSFFEKQKGKYTWDERLDAIIYTCANEEIAKATRKLIQNKDLSNDSILKVMNKDSQLNLKIESGKYSKGENGIIDSVKWVEGITNDIKNKSSIVFVKINSIIPKGPKTLIEARGLITSDYQAYLEKEWISELKKKYTVEVNKSVFDAIK